MRLDHLALPRGKVFIRIEQRTDEIDILRHVALIILDLKKDTVAWFCCFAPYDHPRYTIVTMVQGGQGAAREFCDVLMVASGYYVNLLQEYLS